MILLIEKLHDPLYDLLTWKLEQQKNVQNITELKTFHCFVHDFNFFFFGL